MNRVWVLSMALPLIPTALSCGTSFRSEAELATNLSMWATDPRQTVAPLRAAAELGCLTAPNFWVLQNSHTYRQTPRLAGGTLKTL